MTYKGYSIGLIELDDETLTIAREAKIRAEIYHLKASGESNWKKLDAAISKVEAARKEGLEITADMYNYTAGSTGLDAAMPPWVQEGGYAAWSKRLQDRAIRERVRGGDPAPVIGVVHHGREKVGGRDDRRTILDLDHRGVVPVVEAHQQLAGAVRRAGAEPGDHRLQLARRDLAGTAAAVCILREADRLDARHPPTVALPPGPRYGGRRRRSGGWCPSQSSTLL